MGPLLLNAKKKNRVAEAAFGFAPDLNDMKIRCENVKSFYVNP
jgi:hypothetical protein